MNLRHISVTLLSTLLLVACGKKDDSSAPLAFVPADTPYVYANLESIPRKTTEAWLQALMPGDNLMEFPDAMLNIALDIVGDAPARRRLVGLRALLAEFDDLDSWQEHTGMSLTARGAIYGIGIVPVMRVELADPDTFKNFIARVEQALEYTLPTDNIDGQSYWYFSPSDNTRLVLAVVGDHMVATVHFDDSPYSLQQLLGMERPQNTLLANGALAQLNREFGFTPYGTALVDLHKLFDQLMILSDHAGWTDNPFTLTCRDEFQGLIDLAPRVVFGVDRYDQRQSEISLIVDVQTELREALAALPAPVPGRTDPENTFASVGFGLHLDKLADFLMARVNAIADSHFECEMLAEFNDIGQMRAQMQQAMAGLYMTAGWFQGLRLNISDFTWQDMRPQTIEATLIVASPSPANLIGMVQAFAPPLAGINLNLKDQPQTLDTSELAFMAAELGMELPPAHIIVGDQALGLSLGHTAHNDLAAQMAAAPQDPPPLLYTSISGEAWVLYMREIGNLMTTDFAGALDVEDEALEGAIGEFGSLYQTMARMYEQVAFEESELIITERGVEMRQRIQLK